MRYTSVLIKGVPYSQVKSRGKTEAAQEWTDAVIEQTRHLPRVSDACLLKVTFLLPPDKFPTDFPYGPDLDNLLKRFLDALGQTLFSATAGGDSCIVSIHALKTRVDSPEKAGAHLEVLPFTV